MILNPNKSRSYVRKIFTKFNVAKTRLLDWSLVTEIFYYACRLLVKVLCELTVEVRFAFYFQVLRVALRVWRHIIANNENRMVSFQVGFCFEALIPMDENISHKI